MFLPSAAADPPTDLSDFLIDLNAFWVLFSAVITYLALAFAAIISFPASV
jgi:hypothetical protein